MVKRPSRSVFGHPGYDLYALRVDLDRLAFVLGADHDEPLLQPRER